MKKYTKKHVFQSAIVFLHLLFASMNLLHAQNPVGAIPGVVDVSPMGAATYTIPIEVVPGTQGMQPNLSIVYNSAGGMGLLGMKWNLAGLSAITRCGQTPYYDDNITAIGFSRFSHVYTIDGERILKLREVDSTGYQIEYATEMENFSRVYSHGVFSPLKPGWKILFPDIPTHFSVYTEDGSIIEYGNTDDSKQKLGTNPILSWYINKITDADGNFMTYHYGHDNKEYWIDSIKYTGNGSMQPYAKVRFGYSTLPDTLGKNTCFIGGYSIPQTKILNQITISYGSDVVRRYQFYYNLSDRGERTAHLKEIILKDPNGLQLDATTINWGKDAIAFSEQIPAGIPAPSIQEIIVGDFNGDGYTDLFFYGISDGNNKKWELYLYKPNTKTYNITRTDSYNEADNVSFYVRDINGDGKDELIICKLTDKKHDIYTFTFHSPHLSTAEICNSVAISNFRNIAFGDFDANGSADIVISTSTSKTTWHLNFYTWKEVFGGQMGMGSMGNINNIEVPKKADLLVRVLEANGNGKMNIMAHHPTQYQANIYEYSIINSNFDQKYESYPTYFSQSFGDVNGDGITDILIFYYDSGEYKWKIQLAKGDGNFVTHIFKSDELMNDNNSYLVLPLHPADLVDINGDGKDDIIQRIYDLNNNQTTFNILLSQGYANGVYKFKQLSKTVEGDFGYCPKWSFGDFNGDGKLEMLLLKTSSGITTLKIISLDQDPGYEFVADIEDGIGKKIKLTYKHQYLDTYFYDHTVFGSGSYRKMFLSVVDKIEISNGVNNNFNTLQANFYNPIYNVPRRAFLGFKEFVSIHQQENKRDSAYFHYYAFANYRGQTLLPKGNISFSGNQQTGKKEFIFEAKMLGNNRFTYKRSEIDFDYLSDVKVETKNVLNDAGRVIKNIALTYDGTITSSLVHLDTTTFFHDRITLSPPYHKKTILLKTLHTQKYGNTGTLIADTTTYSYYTDATNNGRLEWVRQGNIDGAITTHYGNYTAAGLYQTKTVSAAGCTPRQETYTYDSKQRFLKTATNALGHTTTFIYDDKTGNKTQVADPNGLTTKYNYDTFGNLTKVTYPDGTCTKDTVKWYSSNILSDIRYYTTTTSTAKPELRIYYDVLGREIRRYEDGYYYGTKYNSIGQVVATSGPAGSIQFPDTYYWYKYTYDEYGRKKTEMTPYSNLTYTYNAKRVSVYDNLRKVSSYKDYDALGRITQAHDEGGDISYAYAVTSNKRHQTTINAAGAITTILTDLWGNRRSITEPNAGMITSTYNGFNELIKQIDARGDTTTYAYDVLGRVTDKTYSALNTPPKKIKYRYDNRFIGKLSTLIVNNFGVENSFYDNYGRVIKYIKNAEAFQYEYNNMGQLTKLSYPAGFAVKYSYDTQGKLDEIRNAKNNSLIYKVHARNEYNAPKKCEYGNEVFTEYSYYKYGLLERIKTGNMQCDDFTQKPEDEEAKSGNPIGQYCWVDSALLNYRYAYNNKGLMSYRSERIINYHEKYGYDKLDRLDTIIYGKMGVPGTMQLFHYNNKGNITYNSAVGDYIYAAPQNKPHAVSQINPINNYAISQNQCDVEYNFFNQPTQIKEGDYKLELLYWADQQRTQMMKYKKSLKSSNNKERFDLECTHYYTTKYYETEVDSATRHYHYIYGDNGIVAMHIFSYQDTTSGGGYNRITAAENDTLYNEFEPERWLSVVEATNSIYYIHTDHLGSYCAITGADKKVKQRNYFDPWGNFKSIYIKTIDDEGVNIDTLEDERGVTLIPINFTLTRRGFTGHEHYPQFKIINMNGRLYDPVIARFFSPDKYVMNSSFTQDFNRYSYARNNPLMYTDPEGEWVNFVFGAILGGLQGISQAIKIANDKGASGGAKFGYMMLGGLIGSNIGLATAGIGAMVGTALPFTGAAAGAISGGVSGLASGTANGLAMGALGGQTGNNLWNSTWKGGLMGMGMGAVMGGIMGGWENWCNNKNIWFDDYVSLQARWTMWVENNKAMLIEEIGEAGVSKLQIATRKTIAEYNKKYGTSHTLSKGKIWLSNGDKANGISNSGASIGEEGITRYIDNEILIARSRVRDILKELRFANETVKHEWKHCRDNYTGDAHRIKSQFDLETYNNIMEFRAYEMNFINTGGNSPFYRSAYKEYFNKVGHLFPLIP